MTDLLLGDVALAELIRGSTVDTGDGCWTWTGYVTAGTSGGYGEIRIDGERWKAHRLSYRVFVGPVPAGLELDHLCRNRACCNPDHLEAVSHRENQVRGTSPAGLNARKTHCDFGHTFDAANTYRPRRGGRQCRSCSARRARERRAAA